MRYFTAYDSNLVSYLGDISQTPRMQDHNPYYNSSQYYIANSPNATYTQASIDANSSWISGTGGWVKTYRQNNSYYADISLIFKDNTNWGDCVNKYIPSTGKYLVTYGIARHHLWNGTPIMLDRGHNYHGFTDIVLCKNNLDDVSDVKKTKLIAHEMGHAYGLAHPDVDIDSIMTTPIYKNWRYFSDMPNINDLDTIWHMYIKHHSSFSWHEFSKY